MRGYALSSFAGPLVDGIGAGTGFSGQFARGIAGGAVGAGGAALVGGDFYEGAITGATIQMFNDYLANRNGIAEWAITRDGKFSAFSPVQGRVAVGQIIGDNIYINDDYGGGIIPTKFAERLIADFQPDLTALSLPERITVMRKAFQSSHNYIDWSPSDSSTHATIPNLTRRAEEAATLSKKYFDQGNLPALTLYKIQESLIRGQIADIREAQRGFEALEMLGAAKAELIDGLEYGVDFNLLEINWDKIDYLNPDDQIFLEIGKGFNSAITLAKWELVGIAVEGSVLGRIRGKNVFQHLADLPDESIKALTSRLSKRGVIASKSEPIDQYAGHRAAYADEFVGESWYKAGYRPAPPQAKPVLEFSGSALDRTNFSVRDVSRAMDMLDVQGIKPSAFQGTIDPQKVIELATRMQRTLDGKTGGFSNALMNTPVLHNSATNGVLVPQGQKTIMFASFLDQEKLGTTTRSRNCNAAVRTFLPSFVR